MSSRAEVGRSGQSGRGGWWFLLGTVFLYAMLYPFQSTLVQAALGHFLGLLRTVAPVLAVVMVLLWLVNLLVDPRRIRGSLGRGCGLRGWLIAIVAGILSHGPVYAWYPLLTDLQRQGTRPALLAVFLYARSIKLPWLPMLAYYFGTGYMVLLALLLVVVSPLVGLTTERFCCKEGPTQGSTDG